MIIAIVFIAVSFIAFIIIPLKQIMNFQNSIGFNNTLPSNNNNFGLIFIPFIGFAIFSMLTSYLYGRYKVAYAMVVVINQIEQIEKILIENIDYTIGSRNTNTLYVIKLLIQTHNLEDYEIIENTMVAKKDLHLTKKDVTEDMMPEVVLTNINKNEKCIDGYCPKCGTQLEAGDNFCSKCGYRI